MLEFLFRSDWTLAARGGGHMKLRLAETVNRLNVEHRTSNIERRILMTLRFIDFKKNEPQPATSPSVVSPGLKNSGSNDSAESNFEGLKPETFILNLEP
jgi:hypothetical protein